MRAHDSLYRQKMSFADNAARLTRRLIGPLLLSSVFSVCAQAPATRMSVAADQTNTQQDTITPDNTQYKILNMMLRERARGQYPAIIQTGRTQYSTYLDSLSTALNGHLRLKQDAPEIMVVDPSLFDTGVALDFDPVEVMRTLLREKNVPYEGQTLYRLTQCIMDQYPSIYSGPVYAPMPMIWRDPDYKTNKNPMVFVPALNSTSVIQIPGLPFDKTVRLVNIHESAHALEFYYNYDSINLDVAARFDIIDAYEVANNIDGMRKFTIDHKKECYADVFSVGRMIRDGEDIGLIGIVATYRDQGAGNIKHFTTSALKGLEKEIDKMGLAAFRKMDESKMEDFYYKVTEKYTVSYAEMNLAFGYLYATKEERQQLEKNAKSDAQLKRAVTFAMLIVEESIKVRVPQVADPIAEQALAEWDVNKEWLAHAARVHKIVTPETLILSYVEMMEGFAAERKKDLACDVLCGEKMARLRYVYINNLMRFDFVRINQDNGISAQQLMESEFGGKIIPFAIPKKKDPFAPSSP